MSIRDARLRHRIEFQEQVTVRDSDGVASTGWDTAMLDSDTPLDAVPAEVLTGPGREAIEADQKQGDTAARIMCRWFPGLDASWRIVWNGELFDIETVDTDRTGRLEYRIRCRTGMNEGQ